MKKSNILLILLLFCLLSRAQHTHHYECNCSKIIQQENQDPKECRTHDNMESFFAIHPEAKEEYNFIDTYNNLDIEGKLSDHYVIPVVFHVFGESFNNNLKVDNELIQDALRQTNMDFQGLTEGWETSIHLKFNDIKQKLNIEFKLAQIDPDGNPTNGITYHPKIAGIGHDRGYDHIVKKYAWNNYKYMNVYIVRDLYDDGDFYNSGVSWYPNKWMSDNNLSRVVYNGSYLGSNTDKNFRKILTHEFGHWLNLGHTFSGGCYEKTNDADELKRGDCVADTPPANKSHMRIDELNCRGELTNTQNFMNYTKDYAMFTKGQVKRMLAALQHEARKPLWQENNLKATGVDLNYNKVPMISISSKSINESDTNDGIIKEKLIISANNGVVFTEIKKYIDRIHYQIKNVPVGLLARIKYINNKQLELSFSGKAYNHNKSDNVDNIEISFTKKIFSSDFKQIINLSIPKIKIFFIDPYTEYCVFKSNWDTYAYINKVEFANISYPSGKDYYINNLKSVVSNIKVGQAYHLKVRINQGKSTKKDENVVRAWFDWNGNFMFEDSERLLNKTISFSEVDSDGNIEVDADIIIPKDIVKGKIIGMRIFTHFKDPKASDSQGENPCDKVDSGEAEDFGLIVVRDNSKLQAKFTCSKKDVIYSEPVIFSDLSTSNKDKEIKSWKWSFPGGIPSQYIGQHPPKIYYLNEGTYSVELEITDEDDQKSVVKKDNLIKARYEVCKPNVKYSSYSGITNVKLHTLNHSTEREAFYNDYYISKYTELVLGETYDLSVTVNKGRAAEYDWDQILIWIDWNYNSSYDENELVGLSKFKIIECDKDGNYTYNTKITVPLTAKIQKTHMRTMVKYVDKNSTLSPCDVIDSGEIEDYGILLKKGKATVAADFIVNKNNPRVSEPILFSNRSSTVDDDPIVKWEWKFEGGIPASSNKENPDAITYTKAGKYGVSLKVTSQSGKTSTKNYPDFIVPQYVLCNPDINFSGYSYITNVKIGDIDHKTGDSKMCTSYFNTQKTDVIRGLASEVIVDINTGRSQKNNLHILEVWADWNNNAILEDSEIIAKKRIISPENDKRLSYIFPFTVPANAHIGKAILRVITYSNEKREKCDNIRTGEAEDYALNVKENPYQVKPEFRANKTSLNIGQEISFTNLSFVKSGVNVTSWNWKFPGSNTPEYQGENPPSISYHKTGNYDVSLETISENGKQIEYKTDYINILYHQCEPHVGDTRYSYISNVKIGDMINTSKSNAYVDYSKVKVVNVKPSQVVPIEIIVNTGNSGDTDELKLALWIDWNRDAHFDKDELSYHKSFVAVTSAKSHVFRTEIKVPAGLNSGKVIVRTMVEFSNGVEYKACGNIESGEAEDYALNIVKNQKPIANAGYNKTVKENVICQLNGSGRDDDGDKLTYNWTAPKGIKLSDINSKNPTFRTPIFVTKTPHIFIFTLVVNDGRMDSDPDKVYITVSNKNNRPVANAGYDQKVWEEDLVTLAGAGSDPENNNLTYEWFSPEEITLSDSKIINPTFQAPTLYDNIDKTYTFSLKVSDGEKVSKPAYVNIKVQNRNQKPIVNAGNNQVVSINSLVQLEGSGRDADHDKLNFLWTAPIGIILSDNNIANPTFVAPYVETSKDFSFNLVVSDGFINSEKQSVIITVKNSIVTGIRTISKGNIILYPSVFSDKINLYNKSDQIIKLLAIYNLSGQKVFEQRVDSKYLSINLTKLSKGMYIVNLYSEKQNVQSFKIIKQ